MPDYVPLAGETWHVREGQTLYIPGGYALLARKFFESPDWQFTTPTGRNLMTVCIAKANFEPRQWYDGQHPVTIGRGQFVTTLEALTVHCGAGTTIKEIRTAITHLTKSGFMVIESVKRGAHSYTLITVAKYDAYQDMRNYQGERRARDGRETGTKRAATNAGKEVTTTTTDGHHPAPTITFTPQQHDGWQKAYAGVDIMAEKAKAEAWLTSNPHRPKKRLVSFFNNWLARAHRQNGAAPSPKPRLTGAY